MDRFIRLRVTYIMNRAAAKEALNKAAGAYQSVIQTSDDERLTDRARLGLARVYEMQGDLDKAKAQYGQVTGSYAVYAKAQAERLSKPETKDTYAWLETAQPPLPKAPMGPGTPGQKPEFSPGEIALPNGGTTEATPGGEQKNASETFDNLLKDMQKDSKSTETGDRYKNDQAPAGDTKGQTQRMHQQTLSPVTHRRKATLGSLIPRQMRRVAKNRRNNLVRGADLMAALSRWFEFGIRANSGMVESGGRA